jgi:signal transduction histidine kinase
MLAGSNPKFRDAAIGIVLFVALLTLAVLQYRWIGQVSEADRDRLQRGLRTSVNRFSDDFNGEIERLVQVLTAGPNDAQSRVALWSDVAQHPGILKKVWAADALDLPGYLRPLAGRLPADVSQFRGGRGGGRPLSVDASVPALAVPQVRPNPNGDDVSLRWLIVELDSSYIRDTWVPELIEKDFGPDYEARVSSRGEAISAEAEVAPLFALRSGPFGRGGKGGPPGFADKRGKRGGSPAEDGPWRIVASYKLGSMTQMVENLRLRNLAVSFGILLLMGVSVGMLMLSTRRANALARQQMEFVAGVTHELRTPLAVIQSASQNLADGVASGEAQARRYGGVIFQQSKRLGNMVEQVLRFAGLSSQHGELQRGPVEVSGLIDQAVADCQSELTAVGSEVARAMDTDLPAIDGDQGALLHCLRNLLSNAAKHGGGAGVRIEAHKRDAMIEIVVEDSGPGIDPADLPHVFEPFYRGARAKDDQVQGSGLGLSLVKKIVEAHGGTVNVTSPMGARFRLLLPAVTS